MLFLSCGCALQFFPAKGFLGARTEMATAAAETTGSAPEKEVVEKKVELMKEVCSTSPYSHTSVGAPCSFLPSFVFLFFEFGW